MQVCLLAGLMFSLQKGEHVGPIFAVVLIPSSFLSPNVYL